MSVNTRRAALKLITDYIGGFRVDYKSIVELEHQLRTERLSIETYATARVIARDGSLSLIDRTIIPVTIACRRD